MRNPYENVFIGNFLYMLGLRLGLEMQNRAPASCVNLLQQTPADKKVGDLMLEFAGAVRIVEFKRVEASLDKELEKLHQLRQVLPEELEVLSRDLHAFVLTHDDGSLENAEVRPYIDFNSGVPAGSNAKAFLDALVADVKAGRPKYKGVQIKRYLDILGNWSDVSSGTSGFIVAVDSDGTVHQLPIEDFRELRLQVDLIKHNRAEVQRELEDIQEKVLTDTLDLAAVRERERHPAPSRPSRRSLGR
jgi:hypothetical protein